jgi:N-acetylglutamate synthase-like GNAT family acetyltransferase
MIIRKYKPEDAAQVDEIFDRCHKGTFARPNLSHVVSAAVMEHDGKIVGFGALEAILEAVMIIDLDLGVNERVEILRQLLDAARFITRDKGFERFYMFPSDEIFADVLVNRFGMSKCGPILNCELDEKEEGKNGQ